MSINRVVLVGRLTRDPELRYTPNGVAVANFNIAVNRPYTDDNGERAADFINCVVWRKPAENLASYMKKGNLIAVEGRIQTRTYESDEGRTVFVTEVLASNIQYLESKSKSKSGGQGNNSQDDYQYAGSNDFVEPIDISDDDLPF